MQGFAPFRGGISGSRAGGRPGGGAAMAVNPVETALALLEADGVVPVPDLEGRLAEYGALLQAWNLRAGLMSRGEASAIPWHVADSLSLAPYLARCADPWVDVGTGGGFPAVPLALALPTQRVTLVERNQKKVGFLRKAQARLGLAQAILAVGTFPEVLGGLRCGAVTARAVEKPGVIIPAIAGILAVDGVFLAQRSAPLAGWDEMFHVEQVEDAWDAAGLRRGRLYLVRPR